MKSSWGNLTSTYKNYIKFPLELSREEYMEKIKIPKIIVEITKIKVEIPEIEVDAEELEEVEKNIKENLEEDI